MPKEYSSLSKRQKLRRVSERVTEFNASTVELDQVTGTNDTVVPSTSCNEVTDNFPSNAPEPNVNLPSVELNQERVENNMIAEENDNYEEFDSDVVPDYSSGDEEFENSDYDSDDNTDNLDFKSELTDIVLEGHLTQKVTNKLLKLLKKHGHNDLPSDRRTLLKTPKNTSLKLEPNSGGKYYHFGLETCVKRLVGQYYETIPDEVKINVFIDGMPLAKSSGSQFWPIMISLDLECYTEPVIVGIYHGFSKPNNVNEFLKPLLNDARARSININNHVVTILFNAVICDAPARSFATGTKSHNGYCGCPRCIQEGVFIRNRMTFPETNSQPRTDESFRSRKDPEHHNYYSCLEELLIDMINQIPIDYMHCICLGIVRRLLWFLSKGPAHLKLKSDDINDLSKDLMSMKAFITREFARKPRHLKDIERWKATECRQFLLYTGMIVLKKYVNKKRYDHFLCLSVAIRILADEDFSANKELVNYSKELIVCFINNYADLYGEQFVSYNVHVASHLPECVEKHGCLDKFSAFKYENELQKLKSKIKVNDRVLEQAVNIISVEYSRPVVSQLKKYPQVHYKNSGKREIDYVQFSGFRLSNEGNNNCCLLRDGSVALISKIYKENNSILFEVRCFTRNEPLFTEPCDSRKLFISVVRSETLSPIRIIQVKAIKRKCLKINQNDSITVIPLLHVNN